MERQQLQEMIEKEVVLAALESKSKAAPYARDAMMIAAKAVATQDYDEWEAARDGLVVGLGLLMGAKSWAAEKGEETIRKLRDLFACAREHMSSAAGD